LWIARNTVHIGGYLILMHTVCEDAMGFASPIILCSRIDSIAIDADENKY
jgi:hypothetical protein